MALHPERNPTWRILVCAFACFGAASAFAAPKVRPPAAAPAGSRPSASPQPPPDSAAVAHPDTGQGEAKAVPAPAAPVASSPGLDYVAAERIALEVHPILKEKRVEVDKAEAKVDELRMAAILPKFTVETGMGPAPGLKDRIDTSSSFVNDTTPILTRQRDYNFHEWGPFFGIEATVAQPLNLSRYVAGKRAAEANVRVTEAQFQKERMDISEEAQQRYFQRVYAGQMLSILQSASKELDRAQKKMEDLLDEGDANVKQTDLLELKAGRYTLDKARNEAGLGVSRADLALRFLLQASDSGTVAPKDSTLPMRSEVLPSLDSLKMLTLLNHPDLKRLANGLAARRELVRVAKGEMGPDIFLFGSFKYTKAWSPLRSSGGEDPFARDPLNELTAVGGLGMRLNLNFWSRYEKVRKERIELTQLERTEAYAARGLLLKLQDEYLQMLNCKANVADAQKSLRAAEAWLKGAAMKYDLDPSNAKDLISPYKTALGARRDYYEAVLNYDLAVAKVIKSIGWTLGDFIHSLGPKG
jgi:outer membrane protein TolC